MDDNNLETATLNEQDAGKEECNEENDVDIYGDLDENVDDGEESHVKTQEKRSTSNEGLDLALTDEDNVIEDDVDIYGDLKSFEDHLAVEELEAKVDVLQQKCSSLEKSNEDMKSELEKVNKINLQLKRNISSIFKTAKAELERKEKQLKELQSRYDTLVFRRGGGARHPAQQTATPTDSSVQSHIKKDPKLGNLISLDNETECTVKMGLVTLSFVSEHVDFQKRRVERLKAAIEQEKKREIKENKHKNVPALEQKKKRELEETGNGNAATIEQEKKHEIKYNNNQLHNENIPAETSSLDSRLNLEDGEVKDEESPAQKQRSADKHQNRTRSRSRSPLAKRRCSQVRIRNHSSNRERYERRRSRSPPRSDHSRLRSRENNRSNSRSRGR